MKTNQTENQARRPAPPITGRATLLRSLGEQPPTPARQEPRPTSALAGCGRWLALALLLAGFTLAAQAQRTATATATVMSGFVVDYTVTDGGAGYGDPPVVTVLGGGGTGATAVALVTNGAVWKINPVTTGGGYTGTPSVVIAPPPLGAPVMAIQLAPMLVVDGEPGSTARVSYAESITPTQWVVITDVVLSTNAFVWCDAAARLGQRRYQAVSVPPNPSPNPRTAAGTAVLYNGYVVAVSVTNGGEGYLSPPSVTFVGTGSGATAGATISNGVVTQVTVTNTGSGYSSASLVFSAPPRVTRLTEYRVPRVTVRQQVPANVVLQSTTPPAGTSRWTDLAILGTSSNGAVWFDTSATQAASRFYRTAALGTVNPDPARLVGIPAGSFIMGSPDSDAEPWGTGRPQTQVTLTRGFFMGRYEVPYWDYMSVIGDYGWMGPPWNTNCPASVDWYAATSYCAQLTAQEQASGRVPTGWAYRLPTEAEWEYACRAGSTNRFSYGDDPGYTQLANYAWYSANSGGTTQPVGGKLSNNWGLYDMAGNVSEWCLDWYTASLPGGSVVDPRGPGTGDPMWGGITSHVLRGGCFKSAQWQCRSASRDYNITPMWEENGFRVVLAPVQ